MSRKWPEINPTNDCVCRRRRRARPIVGRKRPSRRRECCVCTASSRAPGAFPSHGRCCACIASSQAPRAFPRPRKVVCVHSIFSCAGAFPSHGRCCVCTASSRAPRAFPRPRKVLCMHSIFSSAEGVFEVKEGAVCAQHLLKRRGRFRGQGRCCVCTASSRRRAVVDSVHSKWYSIEYEASARASARYASYAP